FFVFPIYAIDDNILHYIRRGQLTGLPICRPPHVVVSAARNFAVFTDKYLLVPPRQIGIASPRKDVPLLKADTFFLKSDFSYFDQVLTSTQLGIKRPVATLDSLRDMPTPLQELSRTDLNAWADLHDRLVIASRNAIARAQSVDASLFDPAHPPPEELSQL